MYWEKSKLAASTVLNISLEYCKNRKIFEKLWHLFYENTYTNNLVLKVEN